MADKKTADNYRIVKQIHLTIPVPNLEVVRTIADKKGISVQSYLNIVISEIAEKNELNR